MLRRSPARRSPSRTASAASMASLSAERLELGMGGSTTASVWLFRVPGVRSRSETSLQGAGRPNLHSRFVSPARSAWYCRGGTLERCRIQPWYAILTTSTLPTVMSPWNCLAFAGSMPPAYFMERYLVEKTTSGKGQGLTVENAVRGKTGRRGEKELETLKFETVDMAGAWQPTAVVLTEPRRKKKKKKKKGSSSRQKAKK